MWAGLFSFNTKPMKTTNIIATSTLLDEGVNENTVESNEVSSKITDYSLDQRTKFFGKLNATQKQKNFFELSKVEWNYKGANSKGVSTKLPLAQGYAYAWLYNFLTGNIPSNHTSVVKESTNSTNVSNWPRKNELKQTYDQLLQGNKNLVLAQLVEIVPNGVISSNTLTYEYPQLLSVGDTVMINDFAHTILTESTMGYVYTIDGAPESGDQETSHLYDFTTKVNIWPMLNLFNLSYAINYR